MSKQGLLASTQHPARGTLFPQAWLRHGGQSVRMDEMLGRGWRLFTTAAVGAPGQHGLRGLRICLLDDLHETEGVLAAWLARHGCAAALVRPDHCVFGTAATADGVPALLAEAAAGLA